MLMSSFPAWAALGQYEGSISVDQQAMKSEDHVQVLPAYKVHVLTNKGATVREYVSPKGMVFGISWGGKFLPDLNQLLGDYVTVLQSATKAQTSIKHLRGLSVKTSDFVYSNFGHTGLWTGTAYVPSLVPSNVSTGVVR